MGTEMSGRDLAFEKFYNSKEAQTFCFGNCNNASRDESVGEFSFNAGWSARDAEVAELKRLIDEARPWVQIAQDRLKYSPEFHTLETWLKNTLGLSNDK